MTLQEIENYLTDYHINKSNFETLALNIFRHQAENCDIYKSFLQALKITTKDIDAVNKIPFLPISFFKSHTVISSKNWQASDIQLTFQSSGTTSDNASHHHILKKELYTHTLLNNFKEFYGDPDQYVFLGLLPSYLERGQSSLVYMCHELMQYSGQEKPYFFLNNFEDMHQLLKNWSSDKTPFIIGVTYALIDYVDIYPSSNLQAIIMETGGMKGRKKELTRSEVHDILTKGFGVHTIHSEYGMTELLSQAYALEKGVFKPSSTQLFFVRDQYDPLSLHETGQGILNVIDLANIYSCSFIATEDIGKIYPDKTFEVLGRMDHSALRGCSLLAV